MLNLEEVKEELNKISKKMRTGKLMKNDDIIEKLSDYEHDRWSRWQKHLFSKCKTNSDGSLTIPKEFVDRWTKQMNTKYDDLSEEEKNKDRKEAVRILKCLNSKVSSNE